MIILYNRLMKHIVDTLKHNKDFLVGIASLLVFFGLLAGFVFLFRSDNNGKDNTPVPTIAPVVTYLPTMKPTDTPTPTNTPTPTFTPTPTDTPTPTPLTPEQMRLMDQVAAKTEKYDSLEKNAAETLELPVINITTLDEQQFERKKTVKVDGKNKTVDTWIESIVEVFNCDERYKLSDFASVKVRGNASAETSPFPLRIKFNEKHGMLGLNKGNDFKNWVLLRPWSKVISDYIAFKIGKDIYAGAYHISDVTPVNVYVNGEYYGLYMLAEQNQAKKKRININEPDEGYTGTDVGYLVEIDNYAGNDLDADPFFTVPYKIDGKSVVVKDFLGTEGTFVNYTHYTIHSDTYSREQEQYISKYINGAFEILYRAVCENKYCTFDDKLNVIDAGDLFRNSEETISALMDIESVVDTYLIEEIMGNYDRGNGSFYMCVDFSKKAKYKKLTFIAPWDFNWCAMGDYFVAGTFYGITNGRWKECVHPWFVLLMKEDWFRQRVAERWNELYTTGIIADEINAAKDMLNENKSDFDLFTEISYGVGNDKDAYSIGIGTLNSLKKRFEWLNKQITEWKFE